MRRFRRLLRHLVRWAFRACGGYHLSEHVELLWAVEVKAEAECADLRLRYLQADQQHRMLALILKDALEK